jgi:hypothetical protein
MTSELFPPFAGDKGDLEFQDFLDIYDLEIYCAYMETGSYYDTERESFDKLEYEAYLQGHGQWSGCQKPRRLDTAIKLS